MASCGLADLSSGDFKDKKSQWILPIFTSQISVESISQLADLKFTREVFQDNLPLVLRSGIIPKFDTTNNLEIGPLPMDDADDFYVKAKSDTAILRAIIYNKFPFPLGKGTIIEIYNRNILDGETKKNLIYRKKLTQEIPANGIDSLEIKQNTLLGWIDNDFDLYLKNFATPGSGSTNVGNIVYEPMKIVFKLIVLKINVVELNQGKKYTIDEESDISFDDDATIGTTLANFNLFIKNGFPATSILQAYFLDENKNKVDSLIKPASGQTNLNYNVIASAPIDWSPVEAIVKRDQVSELPPFSTTWDETQYNKLKSEVKYLRTVSTFTTPNQGKPNQVISIRHEDKIGVTLTGKFDIVYDLD
jgi:hypothetical protein